MCFVCVHVHVFIMFMHHIQSLSVFIFTDLGNGSCHYHQHGYHGGEDKRQLPAFGKSYHIPYHKSGRVLQKYGHLVSYTRLDLLSVTVEPNVKYNHAMQWCFFDHTHKKKLKRTLVGGCSVDRSLSYRTSQPPVATQSCRRLFSCVAFGDRR